MVRKNELRDCTCPAQRLELAHAAAQRDELEQAEALFLESIVAQANDPVRPAKGLAMLYGRAGRHFECMLLARFALRRAREAGDACQEAECLGVLCTSLANTPATSRLPGPLAELEALLQHRDEPRAWRMHKTAAFALAVQVGRLENAGPILDVLRRRVVSDPLHPRESEKLTFLEMRLAEACGNVKRQLELLDEIDEHGEERVDSLPIRILRAVAQVKSGAIEEARRTAEDALQLLHDEQGASFMSETRASEGARLGRIFWENLDDPVRSHEAFDLATAAMLNRVLQVDAAVARLEAVGVLDGADESALSEMRRDFMDAIVSMLRDVHSIQQQAVEDGAATRMFEDLDPHGALPVCAWCDYVQVPGDVWLPLGQFAPRCRAARLTHGMCEPCFDREQAAIA